MVRNVAGANVFRAIHYVNRTRTVHRNPYNQAESYTSRQ